jgi:hypothetical protein
MSRRLGRLRPSRAVGVGRQATGSVQWEWVHGILNPRIVFDTQMGRLAELSFMRFCEWKILARYFHRKKREHLKTKSCLGGF